MSKVQAQRAGAKTKHWWAYRKNRNKVWLGLVAIGTLVVIAFFWTLSRGAGGVMTEGDIPVGKQVQAVQLEDSRTGEMFDLGQLLGKRDILIVAYMGEFCLGCSELVGELQKRAADFGAADASLVVLGYETGQTGRTTARKHAVTAYPLLQEGTPNKFTRSIGMWSDHMNMPWMGYVVIDKSGKIVAGEQTSLSEAKGAAPKSVDYLLSALQKARGNAVADVEPPAQAASGAPSK